MFDTYVASSAFLYANMKKIPSSYFLPEVFRLLRLDDRRLSSVNGFCFQFAWDVGVEFVIRSFTKIGFCLYVYLQNECHDFLRSTQTRELASPLRVRKYIVFLAFTESVWSKHYRRSTWHSILASKETHSRPFTVNRWFECVQVTNSFIQSADASSHESHFPIA